MFALRVGLGLVGLLIGEVRGTAVYLPLCLTADRRGIDWLHLREAAQAPPSASEP